MFDQPSSGLHQPLLQKPQATPKKHLFVGSKIQALAQLPPSRLIKNHSSNHDARYNGFAG
jgi:hypothetical protein